MLSTKQASAVVDSVVAPDIFSARTKMFLNDYQKQMKNGSQPDAPFIGKYSLMKIDANYYLGMILKISSDPDLAELNKLNVITGSRTAGLLSIKIPIQSVEQLNRVRGILQADTDTKVNLKK